MGRVSDERAEELEAIKFAAHMPPDYEHGLPSWINQRLYAAYIGLHFSPEVMAQIESGALRFEDSPAEREVTLLRAELDYARQAMTADQQWIVTTYRHWLEDERCVASLEHKVTEARKVAEKWSPYDVCVHSASVARDVLAALDSEPVSQDAQQSPT